ncbi:MAG TPA: NAD(P)-dependent oxidoreductase, partial [Dehalococcoidia bacterium]|nr:NAD(P)-dependent oxidoreductase [Dehalococcoidia bacterium]
VGVIGLGNMGKGIALNLRKAGHDMLVHDARRSVAEPHLQAGSAWADNVGEVARFSEVLFTSLPGPPEVEAVALGPDGLLEHMQPGSTWFDLSTNSPNLIRRLHDQFAAKGIKMLDAPVSGGTRGANEGTLAIWVGGDEAEFDKQRPVLEAMGNAPKYIGPIGAGTVAKLSHNVMTYMLQTALMECFTLGVKGGVEPLALWDALRHGAIGRTRTFDLIGMYLRGNFDAGGFTLRLAHKDVMLATELGREMGVPMRVANLALAELTEGMNRGWADKDSWVTALLQEERTGLDFHYTPEEVQEVRDRP